MLCLFLKAGPERWAVPAAAIVQAITAVPCHPLPDPPSGVIGLFRFRGEVVPVLDLRLMVIGENTPTRLSSRIVVVNDAGRSLGLLAERVLELKPLDISGTPFRHDPAGPTAAFGPLAADADGVLRLADVPTLVQRIYTSPSLTPGVGNP